MDILIALFSMILFPILVGILGVLVTFLSSKDLKFSLEEGVKITIVMSVVMTIGALIFLLF